MAFYTPNDVLKPPAHFNFAIDVVDRWADQDSTLQAVQWINDDSIQPLCFSYRYFSVQSKRGAQFLLNLGAKPGDRVMLMLNRDPAW